MSEGDAEDLLGKYRYYLQEKLVHGTPDTKTQDT